MSTYQSNVERWRIKLIGKDVSPRPDETWPSREAAERAIAKIERDVPTLAGDLEVVEASE